jgi:hypothetical protein
VTVWRATPQGQSCTLTDRSKKVQICSISEPNRRVQVPFRQLVEEELSRLLPVLEALDGCGVPISVDTYKPEVMRAAFCTALR